MKNIKFKIVFLFLMFIITSFFIFKYSTSEEKYLKRQFKTEGYSLNINNIYKILKLSTGESVEILKGNKKYIFKLNNIEEDIKNAKPIEKYNKNLGQPNTFSSYTIDGQTVSVSDEQNILISEGKLRNRLFQREMIYYYTYEVEHNMKFEKITIELKQIDYYCNPIEGEFKKLQ